MELDTGVFLIDGARHSRIPPIKHSRNITVWRRGRAGKTPHPKETATQHAEQASILLGVSAPEEPHRDAPSRAAESYVEAEGGIVTGSAGQHGFVSHVDLPLMALLVVLSPVRNCALIQRSPGIRLLPSEVTVLKVNLAFSMLLVHLLGTLLLLL